jgi:nucleoside 2-deoxyribosyltransferase
MRIFIAYPFTGKLKENGMLPEEYIRELITLKNELQKLGHVVILAHERERWGKAILPPEKCTKLDFEEIKKADIIIAYPGNPPSGGVHIELGWASALQKKIIVIQKENENYSPLVKGLGSITKVITLRFKSKFKLDYLV